MVPAREASPVVAVADRGVGVGVWRAHANAFAAPDAKVMINDIGPARDGSFGLAVPAQAVNGPTRAAGDPTFADTAKTATGHGSGSLSQGISECSQRGTPRQLNEVIPALFEAAFSADTFGDRPARRQRPRG